MTVGFRFFEEVFMMKSLFNILCIHETENRFSISSSAYCIKREADNNLINNSIIITVTN